MNVNKLNILKVKFHFCVECYKIKTQSSKCKQKKLSEPKVLTSFLRTLLKNKVKLKSFVCVLLTIILKNGQ